MSIVGPRPERPELAAEIEEEIPEFCYRLKMKAGLTGYAQVYGKYNTTSYDKLKLDLTYIRNYSLLLDLKLMLMTPKIMMLKESTEGVADNGNASTVVIPAYNAEKYIQYTLDSLCAGCEGISQSSGNAEKGRNAVEPDRKHPKKGMPRLEVLVVDDGSTDQTGKIADQYAKIYPDTVRVIHKENGGHGSGINCGVREARGRYLKIVDADDWVDPQAFSNLLDALAHTNDDAVVSGFYWRFDNGSGRRILFPSKAEMQEPFKGVKYGKSYVFDGIADQVYMKMHGITWRTEILRQMPLSIDEHCYYVDAEYILYPIPWVRTVSFLPDFVYQYRLDVQVRVSARKK